MKRTLAFLLFLSSGIGLAQTPQLASGSSVYIEPMNGYENYLAAAFAKKRVPLVIVADKSQAQFLVTSSVSQRAATEPTVVVNNNIGTSGNDNAFKNGLDRTRSYGSTSASISVIDARSSQVVFAYSVGKHANTNQIQSTAEACAKHLKEYIEKSKK